MAAGEPVDAISGLLARFDHAPLVALGEIHGLAQVHALLADLIRHPAFPRRVHAIVVEFGNARWQDVIDAYVAGGDVPHAERARAWRDFAGAGPTGFRSPIYERFFDIVRAVNAARSDAEQLRVLLGDPPVVWSALRSPEDMSRAGGPGDGRDEHFASVVEREVLGRGQRALLIAGGFHFFRTTSNGVANVTSLVERANPGAVHVIEPHLVHYEPAQIAAFEAGFTGWPVPGITPLASDGRLGKRLAEDHYANWPLHREDGTRVRLYEGSPATLADLADSYLWLGPVATYAYSEPQPPTDPDDVAEVARRSALLPWFR